MSDRFECLKPESDNTFRKNRFQNNRLKNDHNRHTNSPDGKSKSQIKNLTVTSRGREGGWGGRGGGEGEETLEIIKDIVPVKNFIIFKKMKKVAQ